MQDRVKYEYAIIRVVPKVEREEFFNVGVILFSKSKKYLQVKYHIDTNKLKAFSEELDVNFLEGYLKSWELICQGAPAGGAIGKLEISDRFRWLVASRSTIIQSSKPHPGLCNANPQEVLQDIFEKYVL
ncbi:DUF3037 domain-containing protein [Galbibacter orientalis]|uniref:DUF3037 domain-containing protein n=1 Tax=Galbibacter orientalis TaxID=453852 RepID=UPI00307FE515